jgi:hypothetical protein
MRTATDDAGTSAGRGGWTAVVTTQLPPQTAAETEAVMGTRTASTLQLEPTIQAPEQTDAPRPARLRLMAVAAVLSAAVAVGIAIAGVIALSR